MTMMMIDCFCMSLWSGTEPYIFFPTLRKGYNQTIMAYGQTGSGKTFSMFGPPGKGKRWNLMTQRESQLL